MYVRTNKLKEREKEPQREMVGAEERDRNGWPGMAKKKRERERKGGARRGQHPVTRKTLQHNNCTIIRFRGVEDQ
jgi:hypothetical protein